MIRLGKVHNNQMIDLVANNEKLIYRAENIVASICKIPIEKAKLYLERAEYRPRIAALMYLEQLTYAQALTCVQSEFQSLDEQLLNAKQTFNQ